MKQHNYKMLKPKKYANKVGMILQNQANTFHITQCKYMYVTTHITTMFAYFLGFHISSRGFDDLQTYTWL